MRLKGRRRERNSFLTPGEALNIIYPGTARRARSHKERAAAVYPAAALSGSSFRWMITIPLIRKWVVKLPKRLPIKLPKKLPISDR